MYVSTLPWIQFIQAHFVTMINSSHRWALNRAIYYIYHLMGLNWKTTYLIKLRLTKMSNSPVYAAECLHILRYFFYSVHLFIIA